MPRRELRFVADFELGPIAKELHDVLLSGSDALPLIDGATPRGVQVRDDLRTALDALATIAETATVTVELVKEEPIDSDGANGGFQGGDPENQTG
jgi:hypothetical protein